LKLVPVALWPFGREIVPMSEVSAALGSYRDGQDAANSAPRRASTGAGGAAE
jgi:hypothetical protein